MSDSILQATKGRVLGSRASGRLRISGFVPATLYGSGEEAVSIAVPVREMNALVNKRKVVGSILEIELDGKIVTTLVKAIQRDPVKRILLNIDLQRLGATEEVSASVLLIAAEGLELTIEAIEVKGPANAIPPNLEVTLDMLLEGSVVASAVKMPKAVKMLTDADVVVAKEAGLEPTE